MARRFTTAKLTMVSLLSGFAFLMQYLNFPLPLFPAFLKVDFSEVPALVAGLLFGPWMGVLVELIKNLLHYLFTGSEAGLPIGELSNFLAGSIFVVITVWIARRMTGLKGIITGLVAATVTMAVIMSVANYWVILPAYAFLINWTIEGPEKVALVLYGIGPFNLVKGFLIALVFVPLYIRLKPRLQQLSGIERVA
ncbi:ECF transporter S component [Desmospora profundinema]|uniref:Riboflavin transporter n=1 Tax=Desmospora profundinema TaxID=1571184 RepID=A0ABU1ILA3_9BACL|nr:ECF transporter S component [Desmospora profundinema]MDR6225183.1 riboflavin transporter FmnP [Desmospora profundinema]